MGDREGLDEKNLAAFTLVHPRSLKAPGCVEVVFVEVVQLEHKAPQKL